MQFHPCKGGTFDANFTGWRLILACESVGNVGQLAADLLAETLRLPLVGHLDSQHLLPCVGVDAFGPIGTIHLSLDVMADAERQLAIVQQRAPAIIGCQRLFAEALAEWLQRAEFAEVAYCGSIDGQLRHSADDFVGSQMRIIGHPKASTSALNLTELEPRVLESVGSRKQLPPWPLLEETSSRGTPLFALVKFATEGDNTEDARELCDALRPWLPVKDADVKNWMAPASWDCVYGQNRTKFDY